MSNNENKSTYPEPFEKLKIFLGTWNVSGEMITDDIPKSVSGQWIFKEAADGYGLKVESQTSIEGFGTFEENELIGYDSGDMVIHLFSLNKFAVRDHIGNWTDDHTLYLEYNGNFDGKACREVITITIIEDKMGSKIIETLDDVQTVLTNLTLVRHK